MKKLVLLVVVWLMLWGVAVVQVQANAGLSVEVSPAVLDRAYEGAGEYVEVIELYNYGNLKLVLESEFVDFYYSEDGTIVFVEEGQAVDEKYARFSLKEWVEVPEVVELNPRERKKLELRVKVPKEADFGGRYGTLFLRSASQNQDAKQVGVKGEIGILVSISLPGVNNGGLFFEEVRVKGGGVLWGFWNLANLEASFAISYLNTQAMHIVPRTEYVVKNVFNEEVVAMFSGEAVRVFPFTERELVDQTSDIKKVGLYKVELEGTDKFGVKHFSEKMFVVLPPVIWIIVGLLIVWGLWMYPKWYLKYRLRKRK